MAKETSDEDFGDQHGEVMMGRVPQTVCRWSDRMTVTLKHKDDRMTVSSELIHRLKDIVSHSSSFQNHHLIPVV